MLMVCEFVISKELLHGKNRVKSHTVCGMMRDESVIFGVSEFGNLSKKYEKSRDLIVKLNGKNPFCSYDS